MATIRDITPRDMERITEWAKRIDAGQYMSRVFPKGYREGISPDPGLVGWFIVLSAGIEMGTVWLEKTSAEDSTAALGIFLGSEDAFGKGIGREAIRLAVEAGRTQLGLERVTLNVRKDNARAIACYERCGFTICGQGVKARPGKTPTEFLTMARLLSGSEASQNEEEG